MKVLVACEESQEVCKAFRAKGHEAYSCDIQDCSGGHPEWHIKGDVLRILNPKFHESDLSYGIGFFTCDERFHFVDGRWDLIIAHPPCTYLSLVTNRHLSLRMNPPEKVVSRMWKVAESAVFFMRFVLADCERIAVENPLGFMSKLYAPPYANNTPLLFCRKR